jgi:methionine-rich copper-binding protein CopC
MKVSRIRFTAPSKVLFASLVLALLGLLSAASAHAYPTTFTLNLKDPSLTVAFTQDLQHSFTSLEVFLGSKEIDKGSTLAISGKQATVKLDALQTDKTYTVKWQAFSTDGHKTQGSFTFGIGKASMAH